MSRKTTRKYHYLVALMAVCTLDAFAGNDSWTTVPVPEGHEVEFNSQDSSKIYYGAFNDGLYESTNSGATWNPIALSNVTLVQLTVDPNSGGTLYCPMFSAPQGNGLYKSTDSGRTWSLKDQGLPEIGNSTQLSRLSVDPLNSSNLLIAANVNTFEGSQPVSVYGSTDAGDTWSNIFSSSEWIYVNRFVYDSNTPGKVYAATQGGLYISLDNGVSWSKSGGLGDLVIHDVKVHPYDSNILVVGTNGGAAKSIDGGATWVTSTRIPHGGGSGGEQLISITFDSSNPDRMYASGGNSGVWASLDSGSSWHWFSQTSRSTNDIEFHPSSQTLYIRDKSYTFSAPLAFPPSPAISVSGGNSQECTQHEGTFVGLEVLGLGDDISEIRWVIGNDYVGDGQTINIFLSIGQHSVEVQATDIQGLTGSDSVLVEVVDTIPPQITANLVNPKSGEPALVIGRNDKGEVMVDVVDACDPNPTTTITMGIPATNGDIIKATTSKKSNDVAVTAEGTADFVQLMVTSEDFSGNIASSTFKAAISN